MCFPDTVPGAGPLRLIKVDRGVWAAAADAPIDRFNSAQLEAEFQDVEAISRHALAHAAVVEFLFRKAPVIPLKLLTLFSTDEKAVAELRRQQRRVRSLFAGAAGREEWAVRVVVEPQNAQSPAALTSGRAYLSVKRRLNRGGGTPRTALKRRPSHLRRYRDTPHACGRTCFRRRRRAGPWWQGRRCSCR